MGGGGGIGVWGDLGRCERRSEVFMKIQKENIFLGGRLGWGGGVRVDVNGEV